MEGRRTNPLILLGVVLALGVALAMWGSTRARDANAGATGTTKGGSGTAGAVARNTALQAPSLPPLGLKRVATGLVQPTYVTVAPGDKTRLFVTEKTGRIRIIKGGVVLPTPLLDLSTKVSTSGEEGLLSMAFDPHFATNRRFYVYYTNTAGNIVVARYTVSSTNPDLAAPGSAKTILVVSHPVNTNHNGGQLEFGPDGLLYAGTGDGGGGGDQPGNSQNLRVRLGKILRININLAAPKPQIYAYGVRNPWRFSFDRATGNLWIGDVGQNKWEEIDVLGRGRAAGANLGWNGFEGLHVYNPTVAARLNKAKLVWPVTEYSHAVGSAVTGGYVYRGSAIPRLRGVYLFADSGSGRVWARFGTGKVVIATGLSQKVASPVSFGQDTAGELYIVSLGGSIYKIVP
jgi:glucose/arabinose dehydrogenase